jgi:hypothetical protein
MHIDDASSGRLAQDRKVRVRVRQNPNEVLPWNSISNQLQHVRDDRRSGINSSGPRCLRPADRAQVERSEVLCLGLAASGGPACLGRPKNLCVRKHRGALPHDSQSAFNRRLRRSFQQASLTSCGRRGLRVIDCARCRWPAVPARSRQAGWPTSPHWQGRQRPLLLRPASAVSSQP